MTAIASPIPGTPTAARPTLPTRHKLMLLAAFELLVFGFAQA